MPFRTLARAFPPLLLSPSWLSTHMWQGLCWAYVGGESRNGSICGVYAVNQQLQSTDTGDLRSLKQEHLPQVWEEEEASWRKWQLSWDSQQKQKDGAWERDDSLEGSWSLNTCYGNSPFSSFPSSSQVTGIFRLTERVLCVSITLEAISREVA